MTFSNLEVVLEELKAVMVCVQTALTQLNNIMGTYTTSGVSSSTPRVTTSPNVALTSVQIIGTKLDRKSFMLYNNSSNSAYVTFGTTSVSSSCTCIVAAFANWAPPLGIDYTGPLAAIRNAGTGAIIITELI